MSALRSIHGAVGLKNPCNCWPIGIHRPYFIDLKEDFELVVILKAQLFPCSTRRRIGKSPFIHGAVDLKNPRRCEKIGFRRGDFSRIRNRYCTRGSAVWKVIHLNISWQLSGHHGPEARLLEANLGADFSRKSGVIPCRVCRPNRRAKREIHRRDSRESRKVWKPSKVAVPAGRRRQKTIGFTCVVFEFPRRDSRAKKTTFDESPYFFAPKR